MLRVLYVFVYELYMLRALCAFDNGDSLPYSKFFLQETDYL